MASSQEKMICEMLNNVRGCNLSDSSEQWETLIAEYFTHDDNFEPDLEFEDEDGSDEDSDGVNDNGDAAVGQVQVQQPPPPQVPLVSFTEEDDNNHDNNQSLHVGEAVVAAECKDLISEHVEIERKKAENFKCLCKSTECHQAFTPEEMLSSRLELRAFNEGELKFDVIFKT